MDILAEQQAAIRDLQAKLHHAERQRHSGNVALYRMLIDKKRIMTECLEKGRKEAAK